MDPRSTFPSSGSAFILEPLGTKPIGGGLVLVWALFQSLRAGTDQAFLNVDVTTRVIYRSGTLLELCLDAFNLPTGQVNASFLTPSHANYRPDQIRGVERLISGVKITVPSTTGTVRTRTVRSLTQASAASITFTNSGGTVMTIQTYFQAATGRTLVYPGVVCAIVSLSHSMDLLSVNITHVIGW